MESKQYKKEVLEAFQIESPSKISIEDAITLEEYTKNHRTLFHNKLNFPLKMFDDANVLDFGCGTGEVDVVLAKWGSNVQGFDFNPDSIERANKLRKYFLLEKKINFKIGDVDTFEFEANSFDIVISMGVIPHVPNQENMFKRMTEACKKDGFIFLGYIESAGIIQRLMHRSIIHSNSNASQKKIHELADAFFSEHIQRSVTHGKRTARSVVNDYLINTHYDGISIKTLFHWMEKYNLEYYSMTPNIALPFTVDSPYHSSLVANTDIYRKYLSILELRWIFAQAEDKDTFNEILRPLDNLQIKIDSLLTNLNEALQNHKFEKKHINDTIAKDFEEIGLEISKNMTNLSNKLSINFNNMKDEIVNILNMLADKSSHNKDFDLGFRTKHIFKGYNGLTTNYISFQKKA